jgi:hypothetical protein
LRQQSQKANKEITQASQAQFLIVAIQNQPSEGKLSDKLQVNYLYL